MRYPAGSQSKKMKRIPRRMSIIARDRFPNKVSGLLPKLAKIRKVKQLATS